MARAAPPTPSPAAIATAYSGIEEMLARGGIRQEKTKTVAELKWQSKIAKDKDKIKNIRNPVPVDGNHSFAAMYWCNANPVAQPFIPVIKNTNSRAVAIGYVYGVVRKLFFINKSYLCR
jgi:hypothetical protein